MSRATDALLATVKAIDPKAEDAANDEEPIEVRGVELTTWIDALALTLAAGMRVGAKGMDVAARAAPRALADENSEVPNDQIVGDEDSDVLTVDDVAALLKVGRNAIYESVSRDEIPHRRIGKQIRFSRHGIMRWLDSWSSQGAKEGK